MRLEFTDSRKRKPAQSMRQKEENMELKVYGIRDSKGGMFKPTFTQHSHGEAERTFKMMADNPESMVHKYPEDFDLYYFGKFDDQTGKHDLLDTPEHMIKAFEVKSQPRPMN